MHSTGRNDDPMQILGNLLSKVSNAPTPNLSTEWRARRVLVCHPDPTARARMVEHFSTAKEFEVNTADKLEPALGLLREGRVNIVVIDFYFDSEQRGCEVLRRYIDQLKPKARRQLYAVLLASNYRTLDPNAAFIEGVNAVINSDELGSLRPALERSLREYNLLYRTFDTVSGNQPL